MTDDNTTMNDTYDIPDPTEEPLKAAYLMLHKVRDDMNGELYDEHEEVRDWASSVEWAYTAIDHHENFDSEDFENDQ